MPRCAQFIRRLIASLAIVSALSAAHASVSVGQTAPEFPIHLMGGGELTLSQLRGQVVLLNFWATWCGPCRHELPALDSLYARRHSEGLALLGIDVDSYPEDAKPFLQEHPVTFPIALDPDGRAGARFTIDGMPMSVLIDRRGAVRWIHRGYNAGDEREYARRIDELLKGN
jgi:peroxiredoxin